MLKQRYVAILGVFMLSLLLLAGCGSSGGGAGNANSANLTV